MNPSARKLLSLTFASLLALVLSHGRTVRADDDPAPAGQQSPPALDNLSVVADFKAETKAPNAQAPGAVASEPQKAATDKSILDLDIDQLGKVQAKVPTAFDTEVTTVTATKSSVGQSPAAVFVITPEMIRRSGAVEVPELLRMVPGLQVAKVTSSQWAISSRGFNSEFANSLLVLVDGRVVYNSLFGGVFWDTQDLVIQDVDRIEVIRGPGATIWGANAVNGVINIITKDSSQTQGAQVVAGGGSQNKTNSSVRYGGAIGDNTTYRLWVKEQDNAAGFNPVQGSANDAWTQMSGGFRVDSQGAQKIDLVTLQGQLYSGNEEFQGPVPSMAPPFTIYPDVLTHEGGGNILGRWTHVVDDNDTFFVQTYFDKMDRTEPYFDIKINTFDLEFQQNIKHDGNHMFTWGADYRLISDDYPSVDGFPSLDPQALTYSQASAFFQEEMPLFRDDLKFYIGSKFMYYFFTGFEYQPSARLLWAIDDKQVLWGAVSRAVRTPVRIEENGDWIVGGGQSPVYELLQGQNTLQSEDLLSFELGYRREVNDRLSFEFATFCNRYDNLINNPVIAIEPGLPPIVVTQYGNIGSAQTTGFEINGTWKVTDKWKLQGWYSFLYMHVQGNGEDGVSGDSPKSQAYLMSSWDLPFNLEADLMPRFVQQLPDLNVPSYTTMDARLGWRPNDHWECSIVGQNLLQAHHLEFVGPFTVMSEVNRGVYAQVVFRY
ncbi:MAG TPA: TonB-dependent receptor [Planctomycetaceae bacterium]|nr:TonB-dependent receptor [Planctomycetaceae bacterium]